VIFTSVLTGVDEAYTAMAQRMIELAAEQPGFLGVESVHDGGTGITVSYWASLEAIEAWRRHGEHRLAQARGRSGWYARYALRVAKVERASAFER
jgi:heme-degrading monooxygenase HmoA